MEVRKGLPALLPTEQRTSSIAAVQVAAEMPLSRGRPAPRVKELLGILDV